MDKTNLDECLRLVSLARMVSGTPRPVVDVDQVFRSAMSGDALLYVALPQDRVAFIDPSSPIVTTADSRHSGRLSTLNTLFTDNTSRSDLIQRTMSHVALDANQAEELWTRRRIYKNAFPSGLSPHSDKTLALAGWLKPCRFSTSLSLCTDTEASEERTCTVLKRVGNVLISTSSDLEINLDDILIGEHTAARLINPQTPLDAHLKRLQHKASGVYLLYRKAERYYALLKQKPEFIDELEKEFVNELPGLGKVNAHHVARLIKSKQSRGSGRKPGSHRPVDSSVLSNPSLAAKYLHASFISETLAHVLYVTDQWIDGLQSEDAVSTTLRTRKQLGDRLGALGFYERESKALISLILWPNKNPPARNSPGVR